MTAQAPEFAPLVVELFDAFEASGDGKPVIPNGRRDTVVAALTRIVTDPDLIAGYTKLLRDERKRRGLVNTLLGRSVPDMPEKAIVESGFTTLDDETLADLAMSPEAMIALEELLYGEGCLDLDLGDWFSDAALPAESTSASQMPAREVPAPEKLGRKWTGWAATGAPLAACLLVGVGLGWLAHPREGGLYASVSAASQVNARGDRVPVVDVRNDGRRPVFVAIVGLSPTAPRRVFHKDATRYVFVGPGESRRIENFDAALPTSTTYLVVLTETPAGDVLSDLLPQDAGPGDAAQLRDRLLTDLRGLGYASPRVDVLTNP